MTVHTWRISPHSESPHTRLDRLAALAHTRRSGRYLRIPCPAHGGTNPNLALWANDDGIGAKCHSAGCSYADIAAAIQQHYGVSITRRTRDDGNREGTFSPTTRPAPAKISADLRPYAHQLWNRSTPVHPWPDHPARRWLARRNLWRPDQPLPPSLRWVSAKELHRDFTGAGALIAMAAQPAAWTNAWPELPQLTCIQLVYVAGDGAPAKDRGLSKRTYAAAQEAVVMLGNPLLEQTAAPVNVAEGLADALALAAREGGTTIATLGTGGMLADGEIARYLASSPKGVAIYADRDEGKRGKAPAGLRAATTLRRHIEAHGGTALVCHARSPWKDPAEAAAHDPFPDDLKTTRSTKEGADDDAA